MITVMGAGAFGTGLAITLASKHAVTLWARDADHVAEMRATRKNTRRLPDVSLPDAITVESAPDALAGAGPVLLAVPMQTLRRGLETYGTQLATRPLIACCKGVELGHHLGPVAVIRDVLPEARAAILTGPSFAADIARGLPTALTLACTEQQLGRSLQETLSTETLRLYRSTDVIGAELGGALKNVIAIACGAVMGAGLGESARAALMTRGYAEMLRYAVAKGAQAETLAGLSGLGDLALTCMSGQSRNYRFGQSLGRNAPFDTAVTVEGVATAQAVAEDARALGVDMPVTTAVTLLSSGQLQLRDLADMLLSRPLKEE